MLKVKETKVPTARQINNIVSNLREMFPDEMSAITFETHSYTHNSVDSTSIGFYFHAHEECWSMDTWEEVLEAYHCLIGDSNA